MSEKHKRIMSSCGNLVSRLTEAEKDRFLDRMEDLVYLLSLLRPEPSAPAEK